MQLGWWQRVVGIIGGLSKESDWLAEDAIEVLRVCRFVIVELRESGIIICSNQLSSATDIRLREARVLRPERIGYRIPRAVVVEVCHEILHLHVDW